VDDRVVLIMGVFLLPRKARGRPSECATMATARENVTEIDAFKADLVPDEARPRPRDSTIRNAYV
jgi:hypothetical protein